MHKNNEIVLSRRSVHAKNTKRVSRKQAFGVGSALGAAALSGLILAGSMPAQALQDDPSSIGVMQEAVQKSVDLSTMEGNTFNRLTLDVAENIDEDPALDTQEPVVEIPAPQTPVTQTPIGNNNVGNNNVSNASCASNSCYGAECAGFSCPGGSCSPSGCMNGFCSGSTCSGNVSIQSGYGYQECDNNANCYGGVCNGASCGSSGSYMSFGSCG